jgi:F-type H+-transporting ATPase subunit delta
MKTSKSAARYAKALFALASEDRRVSEIRKEVDGLALLFSENVALRDALLTPLFPADQRKAALRSIAKRVSLSQVVSNFFSYLIDQRRIIDYPVIVSEFGRLADESAGLLTAQVITATPLDDRRRDRLRRALSEHTGREVRLEATVDPTLVGGAIARVGDLVFDGTIRTQLAHLRANLLGEGARR